MGVTGLLPQLKEIQENVSLESFRGKTVAIDSYAWLHKSVMTCSWELARDQYTTRYIDYFKRKVKMLQHFGVKPYFVFDGDNFASKGNTEDEREKNRQQKKELALELLSKGDKKNAYKYIVQSVDVTPRMAKSVIDYLKQAGIPYVVAPYEADPQMVYLEKLGLVDGIISEDSDLLVFGAKCLLTKLNDVGECVSIRREDFKKCKAVPIGLLNDSQLRMVACLSGCDYTDGIPRIGIVTAFKLVKRMCSMKKCLSSVKMEGKLKVPEGFEMEYEKADLSFQFQRVFNPTTNEISTLNDITEEALSHESIHECIGAMHDMDTHRNIAYGDLDPITKLPLLNREASLMLKTPSSVAPSAKKSNSMPLTRTTSSSGGIKRSLTTPLIRNIDAFFKPTSTVAKQYTEKSSTAESSENLKLSPTSKRRKLFNDSLPNSPLTSSKFFCKKGSTAMKTSMSSNDNQTIIQTNEIKAFSQPVSSILHDLNSSDFELSDPDEADIDDEKAKAPSSLDSAPSYTKTQKEETIRETDSRDGLLPNGETTDENDSSDSIIESPTVCRRITGASITKSTSVSSSMEAVKKGLFDKFGFQNEVTVSVISAPSRTGSGKTVAPGTIKGHSLTDIPKRDTFEKARYPLKPVIQNAASPNLSLKSKCMYRPNVTSIKTKRGISRNMTLDSFAYRG